MGIQPTRAETGYGYIETGEKLEADLFRVKRFTEKPNQEKAEDFVAAGNYYWNSGMFMWSVRTLTQALREHFPESTPYLEEIAAAWGNRRFETNLPIFIPNVKTSASTMPCWSRAQPKESIPPISSACALILDGMILAHGPLFMNTTRINKQDDG